MCVCPSCRYLLFFPATYQGTKKEPRLTQELLMAYKHLVVPFGDTGFSRCRDRLWKLCEGAGAPECCV